MLHYNVSFVKNLLTSNGQAFECVRGVVAVDADSPDEAISTAKLEFAHHHAIDYWQLHADKVGITRLAE